MLYILSILGIILEVSLPFSANVYIVSIPFLTYLVSLKKEKGILLVVVIGILLSLQTDDFFRTVLILVSSYYLFVYFFTHLAYGKANVVTVALIQGLIYIILSLKNLRFEYLILNEIGFIIMNYIYVSILKKKDSVRGK